MGVQNAATVQATVRITDIFTGISLSSQDSQKLAQARREIHLFFR